MTTKKSSGTKTAAKKVPVKKVPATKASAKKAPAKDQAKKVPAKAPAKTPTKAAAKSGGSKAAAKKSSGGHKYSPEASKNVGREMHEMHEGKLTIGKSGKKVTNPKQAIAIGLSEARRAGKKVPPNPNDPKKK